MNVPPLSRTSVTPTPCVQTPKGPMYVAAGEDLKGTEGTVQVYTINPSMRRHFFQSVTQESPNAPTGVKPKTASGDSYKQGPMKC